MIRRLISSRSSEMQTNSGAIFSKKKYLISKRKRSAYANTICTSLAYRSKICEHFIPDRGHG